MNTKGSLVAVIIVSIIGLSLVFFASIRKKPIIIEADAVATEWGGTNAGGNDYLGSDYGPQVNTIISDNGRLIIGTEDGLYVMPFPKGRPKSDSENAYQLEKRTLDGQLVHLNTILPLGDIRYTGGDGLYKLDKDYTLALDGLFHSQTIYALMDFSDGILVGTDRGLWYHCEEPSEEIGCLDTLLLPNVMVTALAMDNNGLWVGTYGDGLFFYDGQDWRERFLKRDTLAFSFVNALHYSYPYLWIGTDKGIYRHDGGAWSQMFVADSTESYDVSCFFASHGTTFIGTEDGLLKFADDTLSRVADYDGYAIAGICRSGKNLIVATRQDGIYAYNRKEEIVSPEQLNSRIESGDNKEVTAETEPWASTEGTDH